MAAGTNQDGEIGFQIAPMVDVVFVLLLFFMASAGSQIIPKELTINLPSGRGETKPGPPPTPIIIDIFPDGKVQMNNKVYDTPVSKELPELRGWLRDTIAKRPEHVNIVCTGRNAPAALIAVADTVSEVAEIKHAYKAGIRAKKGIDY